MSFQLAREKEKEPIRERLAIVEQMLGENQGQLKRLLDLYLNGEFPREMLVERKNRLESTIRTLENERLNLEDSLKDREMSPDQIQDIQEFAKEILRKLNEVEDVFKLQHQIMDLLDVQVTLIREGEEKIAYAYCILGENVFGLSSSHTRTLESRAAGSPAVHPAGQPGRSATGCRS